MTWQYAFQGQEHAAMLLLVPSSAFAWRMDQFLSEQLQTSFSVWMLQRKSVFNIDAFFSQIQTWSVVYWLLVLHYMSKKDGNWKSSLKPDWINRKMDLQMSFPLKKPILGFFLRDYLAECVERWKESWWKRQISELLPAVPLNVFLFSRVSNIKYI